MPRPASQWKKKKASKALTGLFIGSFKYNKRTGRFFELSRELKTGRVVKIKFTSAAAAKDDGWKKQS